MVSTRSGRVVGGAAASGGEHGPPFGATTTSKAPRTKQPDLHADVAMTSQQVQTAPAPAAPEGAEQPMRMAFVEQQVLLSPRGTPAVKAVHAAAHAAVTSPRTAQQLSSMPLPDADEKKTHARAAETAPSSPPPYKTQPRLGPERGGLTGLHAHGPPPRPGHGGGGKAAASAAGRLLAAVLFVAALATGALLAVNTCDPQLVASARLPPQLRALLPAPAPASPACVAARAQLDRLRQHAADAAHALRPYTSQLSVTISRLQTQSHNLAKDLLSRFQPEQRVSAPEPTPTQRPLPHVALRQRLHDLVIGGLLEEHEAVNAATAAAAAAAPSTVSPSLLDAWHAAAGHAAAKRKALGLLLACNSQGACDHAVTRLSSPPGVDAGSAGGGAEGGAAAAACTAVVSVSELGSGAGDDGEQGSGTDAAGRLQRQLAALLARCGGSSGGSGDAVVVVSGLDVAPLPLVAVLNNALSESGNLQLDGASVDMHAAAFVFLIVVAGSQQQQQQAQESQGSDGEEGAGGAEGGWVAQEDEEESAEGFERRVKDVLAARLAGSSGAVEVGAGDDGQGAEASDVPAAATPALPAVVRALRRRIDLVMQVKAD